MYTLTKRVDVIDYDLATGTVEYRRPLFEIGKGAGLPDGMTVDVDGWHPGMDGAFDATTPKVA